MKNMPEEKIHKLTPEERKKGGLAKTPEKLLAAKLRGLKRKGLTNETAKRLYDMIKNRDISVLDVLMYIESIKPKAKSVKEKVDVSKRLIEWLKFNFGTIIKMDAKIDQRTVTYNINNPNDRYPRLEEH